MRYPHLSSCLTVLVVSTVAHAEPPDFARDIRPILSNRCFKCHGPAVQKNDLRLDQRDNAVEHEAIVPGKVEASDLIRRVTSTDEKKRMPPPAAGDALSAREIELLKAWIAAGAEYTPHWAFQRPVVKALPAVKQSDWPRNAVDRWILARLEAAKLTPSREAERATLIRRLSLDLLGLLPSPHEVAAFVADDRPDAYERLVERLLASPHFGERQARHWLDLARYADSNGYTIDGPRSIWPYRDWVISAFNRNLPFDQFTRDQLAGDLVPNAARDQVVATGFHRNTPFNEEGGTSPEQFRVERTVDRTNTTGAAWLGLTVGCAQCHTHKYDPISHEEYYRFFAFFNSCDEPQLTIASPEQELRLAELKTQLAAARQAAKDRATAAAKPPTAEEIAALEAEAKKGWKTFQPLDLTSASDVDLKRLDDFSVLASGVNPPSDTYYVRGSASGGVITAFRLEALTHESLPEGGPGRASNGNFVLSLFALEIDGVPIRFDAAYADHSQKDYDVSQALLGDSAKGWAINGAAGGKINVNRQAVFVAEKPLDLPVGKTLAFRLVASQKPAGYTLGRFKISVTNADEKLLALPLAAQRLLTIDAKERTAEQQAELSKLITQSAAATATKDDTIAALDKQVKDLEKSFVSSLVLRPSSQPRVTNVMKRGDFLDKGPEVQPGVLAALPKLTPADAAGSTRLDLARWLTSDEQPLVPRVVVNRIWQQYFGRGLVETENDFGMQGSLPTHPELLDWLAVELVRSGWDVKHIHRLIVTSATYRQSSVARADLAERDPQNKLLGRQNRLRPEAEILRDMALAASGLLTERVGGPGVFPPMPKELYLFTQNSKNWVESQGADRYRRGMYTFLWRQSQHPLLTTFDAPDAQTACTRRNRSNTPLQALHLANDAAFLEIAAALGRRIIAEGPTDDAGRIAYAFRLCTSREPAAAESQRLVAYLERARAKNPETAWTMLSRVLMNLDEFVTRE